MKNPRVFIIVLHYQNWEDTNDCLKSLDKLDYDNFEMTVIDNDKNNRGFAGGNNTGIKQALEKGADYILLLNNDTIVEPNFLKKLIEVGESDEEIGIIGSVIYEYGTDKIHFAGGRVNWLYTKGVHISAKRSDQPFQPSIINEVDYITGCCLLIKREIIEKIGLLDEDYFLYCEDVDWCLRAKKAGFRCVAVPEAKIWHKVSSSAKEASFSYIYYHTRNGLLLAKRNAPSFIKVLAYSQSVLIFGKQVIKLVLLPQKRIWARAIMRGIEDFFKGRFGKYENWN